MKKLLFFILLLSVSILQAQFAWSESTVTIPVPEQISNESKNLVLTITVPTELERVERPTKDAKIRKRKTRYKKYFDLNPFPPIVNPSDPEITKRFGRMVAKDSSLRSVLRRSRVTNAYEMARNLAHITNDLLEQSLDQLVSKGVTRSGINEFITVYDNYPRQLRIMGVGRREREEMVRLSRKLAFTDGEIKVVRVETNDIGSTVIQLTIDGGKDKYKPDYVTKLNKGNLNDLEFSNNGNSGSFKKANELSFDENPGSTSGSGSGGEDAPPDEFMDIF